MNTKTLMLYLALFCVSFSCKTGDGKEVERDTTVNEETSFNNLFLDSVTLTKFVTEHSNFNKYSEQISDFYRERNYEYAWFDSSGIGEQAKGFMSMLNNTITTLNDSSLYNRSLVDLYNKFSSPDNHKKFDEKEILNTELLLTGEFFEYAGKMYKGTDSNITDLGWFIPRKKINLTALLDTVIVKKNGKADEFAGLNEQYYKLREFLPVYFQLEKSGNWDSIPYPAKSIHSGDSSEVIHTIKDRLKRLGDLTVNDSTDVLDSTTITAVKAFQKRMGLAVDGVIGKKMVEEINVTPANRIKQILVNLERMRWMQPTNNDDDYIFVNIPDYRMFVYNKGDLQFTMNVIVGTSANSTTIFSGNLKYIVFAPYWNVPEKIVKNEIVPSMQKNPNYLEKNNMEITGGTKDLPKVRQKPGPSNSLGKVKFLFPNNYDIYFHDTPNRNLFSASSRSFSHGCIRLGEPKHLAEYLLRSDTSWTSYRIDTSMNSTKEKWVTLPKTVPVVIAYFTAFVDKDGMINFRKDIYNHDSILADKLFSKQ